MNEIVNEHLKSLLGERNVDRRAFVVTSLGAGFAMAVMPVTAQTITTSAEGLTAGEVKVPTKDGDDARVSRDARDGRQFPGHPGRAGSLRRARAHQGRLPAHREERLFRNRARVVRAPGRPFQIHGYGEACVGDRRPRCPTRKSWAISTHASPTRRPRGKAETARLGITGFCWGGRIVFVYAAHNPNVKAAVAWYGTNCEFVLSRR